MNPTTRCREYREGTTSRRRNYRCRECRKKFQVDTFAPLPTRLRVCDVCLSLKESNG